MGKFKLDILKIKQLKKCLVTLSSDSLFLEEYRFNYNTYSLKILDPHQHSKPTFKSNTQNQEDILKKVKVFRFQLLKFLIPVLIKQPNMDLKELCDKQFNSINQQNYIIITLIKLTVDRPEKFKTS